MAYESVVVLLCVLTRPSFLQQVMSWNGRPGAPRSCLGRFFAIETIISVVDHLLPNITAPVKIVEEQAPEIDTNQSIYSFERIAMITFGFVALVSYLVLKFGTGMGPVSIHFAVYLFASFFSVVFYVYEAPWAMCVIRVVCALSFISLGNQYWTETTTPPRVLALGGFAASLITGLFFVLPAQSANAISAKLLGILYLVGIVLVAISCSHAAITIRDCEGKPFRSLVLSMNASVFSLFNSISAASLLASSPVLLFVSHMLECFFTIPFLIPGLLRLDQDPSQIRERAAPNVNRVRITVLVVLAVAIVFGVVEKSLYELEHPYICDVVPECMNSELGPLCSDRILEGLDTPTAFTYGMVKNHMIKERRMTRNASSIIVPTESPSAKSRQLAFGVLPILITDEDMDRLPLSAKLEGMKLGLQMMMLNKLPSTFPLTDLPLVQRSSVKEAVALAECALGACLYANCAYASV